MEHWLKSGKRYYRSLSLRARFVSTMLLVLIPFLAYVVISASNLALSERIDAERRTLTAARSIALRLDDYLGQMDTLTGSLGPAMQINAAGRSRNQAILEQAKGSLPALVNNIDIWDTQGNNVGALFPTPEVSVADRSYFNRALRSSGVVIEAPVISRGNGEVIAIFARAIRADDGQVIGVIAVSAQLRHLQELVNQDGALPDSSLIAVLDTNGVILARSLEPEKYIGRDVSATPNFINSIGRSEGSGERIGLDGILRVTAFSAGRRAPWRIFVGVPSELIYAPSRIHFAIELGVGLTLVLASMLAAAFIGRLVIEPLAELADDADRFGAGQLDHRSRSGYAPELDRLSLAMNHMAESLQQRQSALAISQRFLAEEKARLKLITDNVPALISYVGIDRRFQFANQTHQTWFGRSADSLIGQTLHAFREDTGAGEESELLDRAFAGERMEYQREIASPTGPRHVQFTAVPDFDDNRVPQGVYFLGVDLTEVRAAEAVRVAGEERLRTITDNMPALICYIDQSRTFRFNNRTYERWLERPVSEISGARVIDVYGDAVYQRLKPSLDQALAGERARFEVQFTGKHGDIRYARGFYIPDWVDGRVNGVYGLINDVTKIKIAEQKLWNLAQLDVLTSVANRSQFTERLGEALSALDQRARAGEIALLFLDVDRFKDINDRLGHQAGDELLIEFARRLKDCVRPSDTVARLGGDEFVILLLGLDNAESASLVAEKILHRMQLPMRLGSESLIISASIGIAVARHGESDVQQLLRRADEALYAAKAAGRRTYRVIA